jgi:predicted dehydrogenase
MISRAGVFGLGRHGGRHLQAYQLQDGVEIAAVCDSQAERISEICAKYPSAKGYTDWREMLAHEQLDIISVVTNGPSHAPIAIAAAEAGVSRIFCEKPMATSVKDAQAMIDTCRNRGARLSISHGRRWVREYQLLHDLIANGLIGKLCEIWFTCGGGLFACNGSHFLDLMRMLSGANPVSVVGFLDKTGTPNPRGSDFIDPGAMAVYWFDNGMRGIIDMYEDLGVPPRIEIVGSIGRIMIDEVSNRWEILARDGSNREQPIQHYWLPLRQYPFDSVPLDAVDMLVKALNELLGEGHISCSGEDGMISLEMVIGTHASSQNSSISVQFPLSESYSQIDIPLT